MRVTAGCRRIKLIPLAEELLEAPTDLILTALKLERSDGAVIADKVGNTTCAFRLYKAEQAIADRLIRIVNGGLPLDMDRRREGPAMGRKAQRSAAGYRPCSGSPQCPAIRPNVRQRTVMLDRSQSPIHLPAPD
jgi:hypothetical protein